MLTEASILSPIPEVWGGIECTINRIGNVFHDQLSKAGHYTREGDIQILASSGISKLRYPVLWERHTDGPEQSSANWDVTEGNLNAIRNSDIDPIVTLLHHGSGPVFTSLDDPTFPEKLACFALQVAQRFPWVKFYTPVNEPLTTARFSGLYGHWYPHLHDELSFVRIFLNEVKAIVLSMEAIRTVNRDAKLVQTEDLCKIHAPSSLHYQAEFENERRWLTYDLLTGNFGPGHFFWNYFIGLGISAEELHFFEKNYCVPEIVGFNYYVTSERYLDTEIERYPPHQQGGNGRDRYVDIEAVRTGHSIDIRPLLREAWERYRLPMAVTECHLNCSREEQMRWLNSIWTACCELCAEGIDMKAVTVWAMMGAFDWNSLLTCQNNHYEPGVFEIINGRLRKTILVDMIRGYAAKGSFEHPLLTAKGWWHCTRGENFLEGSPILIVGQSGALATALSRICSNRGIHHICVSRSELNILSEADICSAIEKYKPWGIINAAGYVSVDDAETNYRECFALNAEGPGLLASLCKKTGTRLMTFSSDLVFDGEKNEPYDEEDEVCPLSIYGASKARGEQNVLAEDPSALVIRTSAFFGPWDEFNFVSKLLQSLKRNEHFKAAADVVVTPTYVPDLVNKSLDLFIDEEKGIWHIVGERQLSWAEFAREVAERSRYSKKLIIAKPYHHFGWTAERPRYSVLSSSKAGHLPSLENAIDRYLEEAVH